MARGKPPAVFGPSDTDPALLAVDRSGRPTHVDAREASLGLKGRALSGVLWSFASRVGQQAIQFGVTVALARLLVPTEFGLVAEILVFTNFAGILVDFGFSAALIQRRDATERHLTSAFWLNLAVGAVLAGAMSALSPAIAAFYSEPKLKALTIVISSNFILQSLGIVQGTLLERDLRFRPLAIVNNTAIFVGGAAAIAAAAAGLGVWSIVLQALLSSGGRSLLLWLRSDWRPGLRMDRDAIRDLWAFSANLAGFNMVNYWSRNADNLLIGRFVGASALGIYSRAYALMLLPITQISAVVGVVMYPTLARIQNETQRLKSAYLRLIGVVGFLSFPLATGLFVTAKPFVLTLFGSRWSDVVPVLQILSVPLLTQPIGTTTGLIYQTRGRTDWMFKWGLASGFVTILSFAAGIPWGVKGVAAAYSIRTIGLLYFNYSIPGRLINLGFSEVIRAVRGPLLVAVAMAAAIFALNHATVRLGPAPELAIAASVGAAIYLALSHLFAVGAYGELRALLRERIRATEPG